MTWRVRFILGICLGRINPPLAAFGPPLAELAGPPLAEWAGPPLAELAVGSFQLAVEAEQVVFVLVFVDGRRATLATAHFIVGCL